MTHVCHSWVNRVMHGDCIACSDNQIAKQMPSVVSRGDHAGVPDQMDTADVLTQASTVSDDAASRSQQVLDKLAAMELQRRAEREKRREEAQEKQDPRENVKTFLSAFTQRQSAAESALSGLQQQQQQDGAQLQAADVSSQLDALAAEMVAQERALAEASYYLPTFDQKQCTANVQEFKVKLEAARTSLIPKRKFAFAKKVARVKGSEVAAAAASDSVTGTSSSVGVAEQGQAATGGVSGHSTDAASTSDNTPSFSDRDVAYVASGRGLQGLRNQVIIKTAAQLGAAADFVLLDLEGCTVFLLGQLQSLRMLHMRNCRVFTGPVTGATFVDDARDCTFVLASYQVRIHRVAATDFYVRVRSRPIIEHSTGLRFAPYALQDAGVEALMAAYKLGEENGMHTSVDDFGWIKAVQSPNWCELPEAERMAPQHVPADVLLTAAGEAGGDVDEI